MGFTQSCFVRKNTKELKDRLMFIGCDMCTKLNYHILECRKGTVDSYPLDDGLDGIDCCHNDELFMSIASIRNDSDFMQWFVDDDTLCDSRDGRIIAEKGAWNLCTAHSINNYKDGGGLRHKATVAELINYFTK